MQEASYMSRYPALAAFLTAHPEVASNPGYYFDYVYIPGDPEPRDTQAIAINMWRNSLESFSVLVIMMFVAAVLAWLVKTVLNHRRWLRLSRAQNEVHNKLLDRFSGTGELLGYVQSSAGRRFLEAAPIEVEIDGRSVAAPFNRILWSVQVGVVLAVGGLGFQYSSGQLVPEVSQGIWLMGVIALAFGLGFILSGIISYVLSRRMGLLDPLVPPGPSTPSAPSAP
jgi:small-conductance mechanosensitive channel